ncbi:MAG TPA: DUF5675 family protein [Nitrospira sp.]
MTLELVREHCHPDRVEGRLSIDGIFEAYSLEPPRRAENPLIDHPAIPAGTYPVVIGYSVKWQRQVPHINNVPGRSNIEIHPLNSASQSLGCIGLGQQRSGSGIIHSADAVHALMVKLAQAFLQKQTVNITIEDPIGGMAA